MEVAVSNQVRFPDLRLVPPVDPVGVDERCARFETRSIQGESKVHALKLALSMIDLTTLEGRDTPGKVRQLCHKAKYLHDGPADPPKVAAVCVYPSLVATAVRELQGTGIRVASVATAFPSGQTALHVKLADVRFAVEEGADEVDMVISRGAFLRGEFAAVFDEIAAVKDACGDACVKVILETGELSTLDDVRRASVLAMQAGADFIKTSTGKVQPAATLPATLVMLHAIRDYYFDTGRMVGLKAAGGISTAKQALHYLVMLKETVGQAWLTPERFRFGASRLADDLLMQIVKQRTGIDPSPVMFSQD